MQCFISFFPSFYPLKPRDEIMKQMHDAEVVTTKKSQTQTWGLPLVGFQWLIV
jgi:hypothetical protein